MKIRKLLPILVLSAVALFVLAGCDSMLEGLFPSLKQSGTNSMTVSIDTHINGTGGVGVLDIANGYLMIVLVDDSSNTVVGDPRYIWLPNDNAGQDTISETVYFSGLVAHSYTAYAWIDADGDYQPTSDFDYNYNLGLTSYSFAADNSLKGTIPLDVYQYSFSAGIELTY